MEGLPSPPHFLFWNGSGEPRPQPRVPGVRSRAWSTVGAQRMSGKCWKYRTERCIKVEPRDILTNTCLTCAPHLAPRVGAAPGRRTCVLLRGIAPVRKAQVDQQAAGAGKQLGSSQAVRTPHCSQARATRVGETFVLSRVSLGRLWTLPLDLGSASSAQEGAIGMEAASTSSYQGAISLRSDLEPLVLGMSTLVPGPCPPRLPVHPDCRIAAPALSLAPRGNPGDLGNLSAELGFSAVSTPEPSIPACDAFGKFPKHVRGCGEGPHLAPHSPSPSRESPLSPDQFVLPRSINHHAENQTRPLTENQDKDRPLGQH